MAGPRLLTRPFLCVMGAHLFQGLGYASMLLLPLYLVHIGADRTEIGSVMGAAAIGGLAFRPVVGWALDRIGRKPTIVFGTLTASLGIGLLGLVEVVGPLVYVARVIIGVGVGTLFTSYFTLASDIVPMDRRTEGIAIFGISGLVPLAINPLAGELGIAGGDIRWFLPLMGLVVLTSLVWLLGVPEPARAPAPARRGLLRVLRHVTERRLWPVWIATVGFAGLCHVFFVFAAVAAARQGVAKPATLWLTYAISATAVRLFGARLPDFVGTRNMVAPALGAYVAAALVVAHAESPTAFVVAGALAGSAHGYAFPVLTSQVVTRVDDHVRGAGLAFYTGLWDICSLVLAPLFGLFSDGYGDRAMFSLAAMAAVGCLGVWAVAEHRWGHEASVRGTMARP